MRSFEKSRRAILVFLRSALAVPLVLGASALIAPGCLGPYCEQKSHCKDNVIIDCLEGEDGDGPDSYNDKYVCSGDTTCTERTAGEPVCLPKKTNSCEAVGKQSCLDGQPVECVELDGGSKVLLPTAAT
jgi:hypothetical protein